MKYIFFVLLLFSSLFQSLQGLDINEFSNIELKERITRLEEKIELFENELENFIEYAHEELEDIHTRMMEIKKVDRGRRKH